jgi:hypothetical protein
LFDSSRPAKESNELGVELRQQHVVLLFTGHGLSISVLIFVLRFRFWIGVYYTIHTLHVPAVLTFTMATSISQRPVCVPPATTTGHERAGHVVGVVCCVCCVLYVCVGVCCGCAPSTPRNGEEWG